MLNRIQFGLPILILSLVFLVCLMASSAVYAQGTAFTYQGRLADGASAANGQYDLQFTLFDTGMAGTGTQLGSPVTVSNVTVTAGIFALQLDFGPCPACFNGAARYLEIAVKPTSSGTFTNLSPRQPLSSTPYAIRSLNAAAADGLSVTCVNCVTSGQIASVSGSAVTGTIPVASVPAGSASYIQNTSSQQAASNFNVSGTGTAGTFNATTQFNIGGSRVLSVAGGSNLFAGVNAGVANTTGGWNSFFGAYAGYVNTEGLYNSFVGAGAGYQNTTGGWNSFFGAYAGLANTTGSQNSFVGAYAGQANTTGDYNSFVGSFAGYQNTTGDYNLFVGGNAGQANTTGSLNSFVGTGAGAANTIGSYNSFLGSYAGQANTTGQQNSFFGSAAGNQNTTGFQNSFFGTYAGQANATGVRNSFFGSAAGNQNTGGLNSFFGAGAGQENTTGFQNSFFGTDGGQANTTGFQNSFFGQAAGFRNTTGHENSFFGFEAGLYNTTGSDNTFLGYLAGAAVIDLTNATAIGANAKVTQSNSLILGDNANVGIGTTAPQQTLHVHGMEVLSTGPVAGFKFRDRGSTSSADDWVWYSNGNVARFFRPGIGDMLTIDSAGIVALNALGSAGSTALCRNGANQISTCSSSLRYKTDVRPFSGGLDIINRLRPISFNWKQGGMHDLGLAAEEVEKAEPLLVTHNASGEVEGVKYDRLNVVLVNAVKEQQEQFEQQQAQIKAQQQENKRLQSQVEALRKLICLDHPGVEVCR